MAMVNNVPSDWVFSAFSIGRNAMAYPAASVLAGGNVRVGLEDNLYLSRGVFATNAQLVEKAVNVVENMGANVIGPDAVRERLKPARAAVIGGGVIGGGWVARLIQNSVDVGIYDPDPEASRKIDAVMTNADAALGNLTMAPLPRRGEMRFAGSVAEAVAGAELIVEAVPERLDIKQAVYAEIEAAAAPDRRRPP